MPETMPKPERETGEEKTSVIDILQVSEDEIDDKDGKLDKKEIVKYYHQRLLPALESLLIPYERYGIKTNVDTKGNITISGQDEQLNQAIGKVIKNSLELIKEKELNDAIEMSEVRGEKNVDGLTQLLNKKGLQEAFKRKVESLEGYKQEKKEKEEDTSKAVSYTHLRAHET